MILDSFLYILHLDLSVLSPTHLSYVACNLEEKESQNKYGVYLPMKAQELPPALGETPIMVMVEMQVMAVVVLVDKNERYQTCH